MLGEKAFVYQADHSEVSNNLISMLGACWLLRKGCQGFLAFIRDVEKDEGSVNDMSK